jgi:hypothetical protein
MSKITDSDERQCGSDANESETCKVYIFEHDEQYEYNIL